MLSVVSGEKPLWAEIFGLVANVAGDTGAFATGTALCTGVEAADGSEAVGLTGALATVVAGDAKDCGAA